MPYNNAPIAPPEEITGSSALPLARVKKIIAMDDDIAQCSNSAAFAISVATEIFIRYLTEQAYNVVKSERKPRRNIAYKDVANAIARIDNLEFLADVVPKTKTYRQVKEEKAQEEAAAKEGASTATNGVNGESNSRSIKMMMMKPPPPHHQSHNEGHMNGINGSSSTTERPNPGSPIADRTMHQRPHGHPDPVRDVEMTG